MNAPQSVHTTLDFRPAVGMVLEGAPPEDAESQPWDVQCIFTPGLGGPPPHVHPRQTERFEVISGTLELWLEGEWRNVHAGEQATVPAGARHTVRNLGREDVRMRNTHDPALGFPEYMATLHRLVMERKVKSLPPRDPASAINLAMLFAAHERTLRSVRPPQAVFRFLAALGRVLGFRLPAD
jgi:mannose-6-phosphate isomerase-like protein (cupin superfamily)